MLFQITSNLYFWLVSLPLGEKWSTGSRSSGWVYNGQMKNGAQLLTATSKNKKFMRTSLPNTSLFGLKDVLICIQILVIDSGVNICFYYNRNVFLHQYN